MYVKTIRLTNDQEEQLNLCNTQLKTKSAQAFFVKCLSEVPKFIEDQQSLNNEIRSLSIKLREANAIINDFHKLNSEVNNYINKSKNRSE